MLNEKIEPGEKFEEIELVAITVKEKENPLLTIHLEKRMQLSDLDTIKGYLHAAFKKLDKEVTIAALYSKLWTSEV